MSIEPEGGKGLEKLFDPESHFAGRRPVLSKAEERVVVGRTLEAAEKGLSPIAHS